jgi:DNA-binding PadR family transcriptional regulator
MHRTERRPDRRGRRVNRGRGRGHGGPRGHRARRGDVRSAILTLLGEKPMHGYEMIQQLEERTGGRWRPSAGSIYPTLQLLEDEGLVRAEDVEGKRVFSLTDEGAKRLAERSDSGPPWEQEEHDSPRHELRSEAFRLRAALIQIGRAGDEKQVEQALAILSETRRRLYGLLAE